MEEFNHELCENRHEAIAESYMRHEAILTDHENKIDGLIKGNVENTNEIKHLIKQLSSQTKAIWGLVSIIIVALVGYFFTK
jgi:hypothetical protein